MVIPWRTLLPTALAKGPHALLDRQRTNLSRRGDSRQLTAGFRVESGIISTIAIRPKYPLPLHAAQPDPRGNGPGRRRPGLPEAPSMTTSGAGRYSSRQCRQFRRTRRCAATRVMALAAMKGSTCIETGGARPWPASFAWIVLKTMCR